MFVIVEKHGVHYPCFVCSVSTTTLAFPCSPAGRGQNAERQNAVIRMPNEKGKPGMPNAGLPNQYSVTVCMTVVNARPQTSVTNKVSALGRALCEHQTW